MDDRWGAWAQTGGLLMIVVGAFRAFSGFIGLFNDKWVLRGFTGYFVVDTTALSWWMILIGLIVVLAGFGILAAQTWARVVGVIAVGLAAISEFFWVPIYPIWSILIIAMYVMILIGLIAWKPNRD
jgi:hypothetical protein